MVSLKLLLFLRISGFLMLHPKIACEVPPDYCFYRLNNSDCNATPTPVFYYYKPGSRCELDTWRGCPTFNKFDNEYECSRTCIYRFNVDSSENSIKHIAKPDTKLKIFKNFSSDEYQYFEALGDLDWVDEIDILPKDDIINMQKILDDTLDTLATDNNKTTKGLQITVKLLQTTVANTTIEKAGEKPTTESSQKINETTIVTISSTLATDDENSATTQQKVVTMAPAAEATTTQSNTATIIIGTVPEVIVDKRR